jgi:hypothetical protein
MFCSRLQLRNLLSQTVQWPIQAILKTDHASRLLFKPTRKQLMKAADILTVSLMRNSDVQFCLEPLLCSAPVFSGLGNTTGQRVVTFLYSSSSGVWGRERLVMPTSHSRGGVMPVQLLYLVWRKLNYNKHGAPAITHKAYLPTAQSSSPTNLLLLMLYLGN